MQLPANFTDLKDSISKLPQKNIALAVSVMLGIYIAYLLALLSWQLFPKKVTNQHIITESEIIQKNNKEVTDLTALKQLNLFGVYNEQKQVKEVLVKDAPETKLRLTLSGTVASDDASIAAAIIENNGKQETYGIGDKITGTRATLESVATDRVLIKQSGRLETLMLDGFKYSSPQSAVNVAPRQAPTKQKKSNRANTPQVLDQRNNRALSQSAKQLKNDISNNPGKITDYLKIVPKRRSGSIVGYQLMPGKKPEFFQSSGLKSGDVAVQMNGLDLTIPSEAAQALKAIKQETELSLLIDRNGEMTEILFSIQE